MICSSSVGVFAISRRAERSAARGPAKRRRLEIPTGAELRQGLSGLMFLLCCRRNNWWSECSSTCEWSRCDCGGAEVDDEDAAPALLADERFFSFPVEWQSEMISCMSEKREAVI